MAHYDEQYEEDQLNEAFKGATVIDCTSESNCKLLLEKYQGKITTPDATEFYEKELKKQIEENALLYKENAKLRRWKESVINLISEKVGE